ncbi:hypothetical protein RQCS_58340 (plasmid) [Rhodococcus qingshengii]|nr:hypothetical protein RQCS_58340 [Rhodococcus qingshengii]
MTGRTVCSRDAAGVHFSGVVFFPFVPTRFARLYVGAGNASSLVNADVIRPDHGACSDRRRYVCRARRAMRPAIEKSRRRSHFGSHRRASLPANANMCIQAVSSAAS